MLHPEFKTKIVNIHYSGYIAVISMCTLLLVYKTINGQFNNVYKPIVIVHGILAEYTSMDDLECRIKELHPGSIVHVTNDFGGIFSLEPMWHQVHRVGAEIMMQSAMHPEGIILIGYSQGGLIARAALEVYKDHNVRTFISLSSPQAGQYGTKFLHIYYPDLALKTAYELFYSRIGQLTSVGNYWNDPHHQKLYFDYCKFLPYVNCVKHTKRKTDFKSGILKLDNLVLIGGPDDGVISPWQSSHFGFYDVFENITDMEYQSFYKNDSFGLRTLKEKGKLSVFSVSGVNHYEWHRNNSVIDKYIIPWLT